VNTRVLLLHLLLFPRGQQRSQPFNLFCRRRCRYRLVSRESQLAPKGVGSDHLCSTPAISERIAFLTAALVSVPQSPSLPEATVPFPVVFALEKKTASVRGARAAHVGKGCGVGEVIHATPMFPPSANLLSPPNPLEVIFILYFSTVSGEQKDT